MEKPSWVYKNKTHFNHFTGKDITNYVFLGFEHNWDIFQFIPNTNTNKYYFYLNHDYKSNYNFTVIYRTYLQKCKHLDSDRICFILKNTNQEEYLKALPIQFKYIMANQIDHMFHEDGVSVNLLDNFTLYSLGTAVELLNTDKKISIDESIVKQAVTQHFIQRSSVRQMDRIGFFGASVTGQHCGYVSFIKCPDTDIINKGFSGCTIREATWLVDEVIDQKPNVCVLEWITASYIADKTQVHQFLDVIIQKLLRNNIIPMFLYLFKTDISSFMDQIEYYEEIATYYNINSVHLYKSIADLQIDPNTILKDSVHTNIAGSKLYSSMISHIIQTSLSGMRLIEYREPLVHNNPLINIRVIPIDISGVEFTLFNSKKYYKIPDIYILSPTIADGAQTLCALTLLNYKTNGFMYVNDLKIQTWDRNCFYMRNGYQHINIPFNQDIKISSSQELFDTSDCKYESNFPKEKSVWIAEIIVI